MDKSAVVKMGAVASASVCALVGGVVLAQYIFTIKKKTGRKTKIIEMVRSPGPEGKLDWFPRRFLPERMWSTGLRPSSSFSLPNVVRTNSVGAVLHSTAESRPTKSAAAL